MELPEPTLLTELPDEVAELFKAMLYPCDRIEQDLLDSGNTDLVERLGRSGTTVYMPQCDRLTYAKAGALVDHAVNEMAGIYRRALGAGLKLFVNNRRVEPLRLTRCRTPAVRDLRICRRS